MRYRTLPLTLVSAILLGALVSTTIVAQESSPAASPSPPGSATPVATFEPLPPTPPPPTPTPRLPEEGGPPGGVLGGNIFVDNDANAVRSTGDGTPGGTIVAFRLDERGAITTGNYVTHTDTTGNWQLRALPDGMYRVTWDPQILGSEVTYPPVEDVVLSPITTIRVVTRVVEIRSASRVLDIDFGISARPPIGGPIALPESGSHRGSSNAATFLVALGLGVSVAVALALSIARRRSARHS